MPWHIPAARAVIEHAFGDGALAAQGRGSSRGAETDADCTEAERHIRPGASAQGLFNDLSAVGNVILAVNQRVQRVGHDDGSESVYDGVLLENHGGQADSHSRDKGQPYYPGLALKTAALSYRDVNPDGVEYMDTGEDIGGGIRLVEERNHPCKYILIRVNHRAQIRAVVVESADHETEGHACKQKGTHPVVLLGIVKKEVQDGASHIKKPEIVGYNKILVERNQIIKPGVYNVIIPRNRFLQV